MLEASDDQKPADIHNGKDVIKQRELTVISRPPKGLHNWPSQEFRPRKA